MKKGKDVIFCIAIFYMFVTLILMGLVYYNHNKEIEFRANNNYEKGMLKLSKNISEVKNSACQDSLKKMVSYSNDTYYTKSIKLKDMFNTYFEDNKDNWLNLYAEVLNNCKISDGVKANTNISAFTVSVANEEIYQKAIYDYEFHIKDFFLRKYFANTLEYEYMIAKNNELLTIRLLVKDVINNE